MQTLKLNNGVEMPVAGYGVFQIQDQKLCEECVVQAVKTGYRLIDTAAVYGNEAAVGRGIRRCGIPREEIFLTSKLWVQDAGYEAAKRAIDTSLENLQTDYLDLYLIHRTFGDYYGAWRAMEEARLFLKEQNIVMEAWAPFAEGKKNLFHNEVLTEIGSRYGKSAAQVVLRWNLQRGIVPLAKSVHRERMEQNFNIFDFVLSDADMLAIGKLEEGGTLFGRNEDPQYAKMINSVRIHGDR